jgi:hypothetical protein
MAYFALVFGFVCFFGAWVIYQITEFKYLYLYHKICIIWFMLCFIAPGIFIIYAASLDIIPQIQSLLSQIK